MLFDLQLIASSFKTLLSINSLNQPIIGIFPSDITFSLEVISLTTYHDDACFL